MKQLQCSPQLNSAQFYFKPMYTVQSNPIKLGAVYNFTIECIEDYKLI